MTNVQFFIFFCFFFQCSDINMYPTQQQSVFNQLNKKEERENLIFKEERKNSHLVFCFPIAGDFLRVEPFDLHGHARLALPLGDLERLKAAILGLVRRLDAAVYVRSRDFERLHGIMILLS